MVQRFYHVVDNFYRNPDKVRQKALEMPYTEPEGFVGWRTQAYQPRGIKRRIEKAFRVRINYWEEDLTAIESCNGVFFGAWATGKHAETVGVHYDEPVSWMMLLIYLTPRAPYDSGTSLLEHRETGLISRPTKKDAELLGLSLGNLLAILERDSQRPKCWREIDRIGNIHNRAVMFPSGLLHCATRHFGSDHLNGRLYQSFHFPLC